MEVFLFAGAVIVVWVFLFFAFRKSKPLVIPAVGVQKQILEKYVTFYRELPSEEKARFLSELNKFFQSVRITGVGTDLEDMDHVFVASAAVIPLFAFKGWEYRNINEVIVYPGAFSSRDFRVEGEGRDTLGMVGSGPMQRTMILSQKDLREGFLHPNTTSNPAIHEFVHLIDKADGATDGLPEALLRHSYALPWLHRMNEEIQKIRSGRSDINPYGTTSEAEFLAVAAEYFFNQPERMSERHPELYRMLKEIFNPNA
ncbi:MAG: zinc-dependent peptidase [Chitinophagaceae bacterium]|nr:zinc-dependent peptidase [Chitinophagaceae bacterium]MCZ2396222.1 zinc-dependent peptidase [Chitinophagales bacterium]